MDLPTLTQLLIDILYLPFDYQGDVQENVLSNIMRSVPVIIFAIQQILIISIYYIYILILSMQRLKPPSVVGDDGMLNCQWSLCVETSVASYQG
jgi:hypothetical protein